MKKHVFNFKKYFFVKNVKSVATVFFCLIFFNVHSEDANNLNKLRSDFAAADIKEKALILKNIEAENAALIPLYKDAVNYVQSSYEVLGNDERLLSIGIIGVTKLGEFGEKSLAQDIRYLFSMIENEEFKIACLKSLNILLEKDSAFTGYLNSLYETAFSNLLAGKKSNIKLLIAYADALGNFADSSSFDILFKTFLYPVNENLKQAVKNALNNISFDYFYEIIGKMSENNIQYVRMLYLLAKENKKLSNGRLGEITEAVLNYGIKNLDTDSETAENLIVETLDVLADLKWSRASADVNKFFYFEQTVWMRGDISSDALIRIIECMGNLGTAESSHNLSIFLGLLNAETEKTKHYDEKLVFSVIKALGKLGDKTAFDYLLYIEYLDYSETVKQAARDAIEELKW